MFDIEGVTNTTFSLGENPGCVDDVKLQEKKTVNCTLRVSLQLPSVCCIFASGVCHSLKQCLNASSFAKYVHSF